MQLGPAVLVEPAVFQRADDAGQVPAVPGGEPGEVGRQSRGDVEVGLPDHIVDDALQSHPPPVFRRVDAADAVLLQLCDFLADDHPAAAAEDADFGGVALTEPVEEVLEVFDVAALVGADGDAVGVFLKRRLEHLVDGPVVAEMDHLHAGGLAACGE